MEEYLNKLEEIKDPKLDSLIHELEELVTEKIPVNYVDGTYEIETNQFTLTFTISDKIFEIRNIDVRGNHGLGHQIISTIQDYANENDFAIIASNVLDKARGFWEELGFQEGSTPDEYYLAI